MAVMAKGNLLVAALVVGSSAFLTPGSRAATPADTVGREDYAVYSQALAQLGEALDMEPPLLVATMTHDIGLMHKAATDSMFWKDHRIVLEPGLIQKFMEAGGHSVQLRYRFADSVRVVLLSTMELELAFTFGEQEQTLFRAFPHARTHGMIGLNRVVYSSDRQWALLYVSILRGFMQVDEQYMLFRFREGVWRPAGTLVTVDR